MKVDICQEKTTYTLKYVIIAVNSKDHDENLIQWRTSMLHWAVVFLIVAIIAGIFGLTGVAGTAVSIAKILFFVFVILFIVSLFFGRKRPKSGL